jgi:hypothetical protein
VLVGFITSEEMICEFCCESVIFPAGALEAGGEQGVLGGRTRVYQLIYPAFFIIHRVAKTNNLKCAFCKL